MREVCIAAHLNPQSEATVQENSARPERGRPLTPGQLKREGDPSNRLGKTTLRRTGPRLRALRHLVPNDTDSRPPFWLNIVLGKVESEPLTPRPLAA